MNKDLMFSSISNEWETPNNVFNRLNDEFNFILDAASTIDNAKCKNFYSIEDNSLNQNWSNHKSIWCNPPYGREIGKFIKKGYEESQKDCSVVFLIPARTDTKWWYEFCSKGEVRFIKGRLKFINKLLPSYNVNGNFKISPAPFPSAIVIFKKNIIPTTKYVKYE